MAVTVDVALESPRQPEVVRLVAALDAYLEERYPPACNHRLDIESLAAPSVRFLVARVGGEAVGCGALRAARLPLIRLEVGTAQPEALALYRSLGYVEIAAFGGYPPQPLSVFMEKWLL